MLDDGEVGRLIEIVEPQHQAEAIGKRQFLLEGLAQVQLPVFVQPALPVLRHGFGDQMPAVAGRHDADVFRTSFQTSIECCLELAIARFARRKRKIVAKDQKEEILPLVQSRKNPRELSEVRTIQLHHPQAPVGVATQKPAHG